MRETEQQAIAMETAAEVRVREAQDQAQQQVVALERCLHELELRARESQRQVMELDDHPSGIGVCQICRHDIRNNGGVRALGII